MQRFFLSLGDQMKPHMWEWIATYEGGFAFVEDPNDATAILVLGGDGAMLHAIQRYHKAKKPFYGLNFGHRGWLLNPATEESFAQLINGDVNLVGARLLQAKIWDSTGHRLPNQLAVNEFVFLRNPRGVIDLQLSIDGAVEVEQLRGDGLIIATPIGSTAYNRNAGGTILPLTSNELAITGIAATIGDNLMNPLVLSAKHTFKVAVRPRPNTPLPEFQVDGRPIEDVLIAEIGFSRVQVKIGFVASENLHQKVRTFQIGNVS